MESAASLWQVGLIALVAGIMIGLLGYRLFGRSSRESERIQGELNAARDEFSKYRADVNQHFHKTSELVNDLTQNYVRVYQHLAEGAHELGDSKTFNNLLEQQPGKMSLTVDGDAPASAAKGDERIIDAAPPVAAAAVSEVAEAADANPAAEVPVAESEAAPVAASDEPSATTAETTAKATDEPAESEDTRESAEQAADTTAAEAESGEPAVEPAAAETSDSTSTVMSEDTEQTNRTVH